MANSYEIEHAEVKKSQALALLHSYNESPFINFPCEIVRLIFERAAAMCPQTTLSLMLVSKVVRAWVEPALYRTVILWAPDTAELFRASFEVKPPRFFTNHVRNLLVHDEYGSDIILACSKVDRLAACPVALVGLPYTDEEEEYTHPPAAQLELARHPETTICPTPSEIMLMGYLDDVPWASPLFRNVKYLYLGLETPSPETACDVSFLPSLTHCAFPYDGDEEDALLLTVTILLESSTLKRLLILVNDDEGNPDRDRKGSIWIKLACMTDTRLLLCAEHTFDGEDWKTIVDIGVNIWDSWEQECMDWRNGLLKSSC